MRLLLALTTLLCLSAPAAAEPPWQPGTGTAGAPPAAPPPPKITPAPPIGPAVRTGERSSKDAAIVIGNEAYQTLPQATHALRDADAWEDWLVHSVGVRSSRVTRLSDVGGAEMWSQTRKAAGRVAKKGTLWVVFSGHGAVTAPEGGRRTLLGVDADAATLGVNGLNLEEAARLLLRSRKAERVVFILDASFDGTGRDGLPLVPGLDLEVPATEPIADDPRIVVWAASASDAPVDTWRAASHGTFTWAALGALRGWADGELDGQRDGRVTLAEANAYVGWTERQLGKPARPAVFGDDKHLDLVLAEGPWLEQGPDPLLMERLSFERRSRAWEDQEALVRAEAAAFWQHTLQAAKQGGPDGRAALEGFLDAFGDKQITISWSLALPEVQDARQLLARYDDAAGVSPAVTAEGGGNQQAAVQEVVAVAQKVAEESCDDLVGLEPAAMTGALSTGQVACLERRVRTERLQTAKEKASLVLIANHEAARDLASWARTVEQHLDLISRGDPRLVMKYAVYLFTADAVGRGEDAIHWADVALENKQRWVGAEHVRNVGALLRLRAEASYKLWTVADATYRRSRAEEDEWASEEWRGLAKDYAREWLDFLRAAGQDPDMAMQLCVSAAGTADFCRD